MELEQQLQILIDEAARYGIAPTIMQQAIAPVFERVARQLAHLEYYVLQNLQEDWVISVIGDGKREKKVIYAFTTVRDAKNFNSDRKSDIIAISLPVVQILFRLFSVQQIESIIFFEQAGTSRGVELKRRDLQNSLQQQLQQLKTTPPDLA
jgi:hypothetical protein